MIVYVFVTYMFINYRHWHWYKKLHSFNKYLLSTFYVLVAILGISNVMANETESLASLEAYYLVIVSYLYLWAQEVPFSFTGGSDDSKSKS